MDGLSAGQTVLTSDGRQGIIRFLGTTQFSPGEWVGVELDTAIGKNNGTVQGQQYFECESNHGLFLRPEGIAEILEHPAPRPSKKANGDSANGNVKSPRPSSGILSDGISKRQSLMGRPGSTHSSRLSMRSPTKSPTKPPSSTESSATSTPRTSTPSNTARNSTTSVKSRPSNGPRASMGPPKAPAKTAPTPLRPPRPSLSGTTARVSRQSNVSTNVPNNSRPRPSVSELKGQGSDQNKTKEEEVEPDYSINDQAEAVHGNEDEALALRSPNSAPTPLPEKERRRPPDPTPSRRPAPQSSTGAIELKRENEQLKAKIRAMETKLKDNRGEILTLRKENEEKVRYETLIQKLKQKIQPQQQENFELRSKLEEAEVKYAKLEEETESKVLEHESMFLDKEVAREQAADLEMQLRALEDRQAEMDEEIEVLRMENQELTADVSPEDKASTNWIHMVQENERLQKALRMLREMQQESELEMKAEIKELNAEVTGLESAKDELDVTKEKLDQTEAARRILREQVESLEEAEETFLHQEEKLNAKETELSQLQNELEFLKAIGDTNDDLIKSYEGDISQLNGEIDDRNARLGDHIKEMARQKQAIEDLEFVLSRFRTLVADYQKREEDLRLSQQVSEAEASDLMTKSRAIMDLNLKLQNSAAKHQLRSIDMELRRLKAEEASEHLEIVQLFLPDSFETEKIPITAYFCFKRILFKANIVQELLREEIEKDAKASLDEKLIIFDIREKLLKVFAYCDRFVKYANTCPADDFQKLEGALFEIEPVERQFNVWVEELRGDGLSKARCNSELTGSLAFFADLIEKLLPLSSETRAHAMTANASLILGYVENIGNELDMFQAEFRTLSTQGGETNEDENDITNQQLEKVGSKIRSIKVIAGKALRNLSELTGRSLVLDEEVGLAFEQIEQISRELSHFARRLGEDVQKFKNDDTGAESRDMSQLLPILSQTTVSFFQSSSIVGLFPDAPNDMLHALSQVSTLLSTGVDNLTSQSADSQLSTEFEQNRHPWVFRAQALKSDQSMTADTEALISRLRDNLTEHSRMITEKDKSIEEQTLRIELLESRTRDAKEQAAIVKGLESEIERAKRERNEVQGLYDAAKAEFLDLQVQRDDMQAELDILQRQARQQGAEGIGVLGAKDLLRLQTATAEVERLQAEREHLQAAVRFLREENRRARLPPNPTDAIEHAWLSAPLGRNAVHRGSWRAKVTASECERGFDELFRVAQSIKPISLKAGRLSASAKGEKPSVWRPVKTTPRYHALRQREELQRWLDMKQDLIERGRGDMMRPSLRSWGVRRIGLHLEKPFDDQEVRIVGSPP